MRLTKEENEMLDGKYGYPVQKNMEILVGMGECFDAERMLPVNSSHLLPAIHCIYEGGASFMEEMAEKDGKCRAFTTINPNVIDPLAWQDKDVGISEKAYREQTALTNALDKMGASLCHSCTPFMVGHVPGFRQHIAWSESSAVVFANSVLGARTNREGAASALSSSITGLTPEYGYHFDENRYGDLEIVVTTELNGIADYGALGEFVGKVSEDKVPVLTGLPPTVSWDELSLMGAQVCTSGDVTLFHAVGVTPEAPTREAAFGPKKPGTWEKHEFGKKELRETEESLSKATTNDVDLVMFGCPHGSIEQLKLIARLLDGKKLKPGVELWVTTSHILRTYAANMGYVKTIEASGARVLADVCPNYIAEENLVKHGPRTVATDSARITFYMPPIQGAMAHFGSTERCVEAAISGKWR